MFNLGPSVHGNLDSLAEKCILKVFISFTCMPNSHYVLQLTDRVVWTYTPVNEMVKSTILVGHYEDRFVTR